MKQTLFVFVACMFSATLAAPGHVRTEGNIRIHLVSVERGRTLLPMKNNIDPGTEFLAVTYIVEYRASNPISLANCGGLSLWSGGKQIEMGIRSLSGELSHRDIDSRFNLKDLMMLYQNLDLSMIKDISKADLRRSVIFGQLPEVEKLDIKIEAGFNNEVHSFVFTDTPFVR